MSVEIRKEIQELFLAAAGLFSSPGRKRKNPGKVVILTVVSNHLTGAQRPSGLQGL